MANKEFNQSWSKTDQWKAHVHTAKVHEEAEETAVADLGLVQCGVGLKFEVGQESTIRVSEIDPLGACCYDVDVLVGDVLYEVDGIGVQVPRDSCCPRASSRPFRPAPSCA